MILGETGYEDEPNAIELLPDAKQGDLWNPYRIRRNAWWAVLSGASGYCAGTRLWRFEPNWREVLGAESTRQAPLLRRLIESRPWWRLVPDTRHEFVTAGYGTWKKADYVTAALAQDGSLGLAYTPDLRTLTVDLGRILRPGARHRSVLWRRGAGLSWAPTNTDHARRQERPALIDPAREPDAGRLVPVGVEPGPAIHSRLESLTKQLPELKP